MSRGCGELRTFDGVSVAVEHAHIDRPYKVKGEIVRIYCERNPNVACRECVKRIAI